MDTNVMSLNLAPEQQAVYTALAGQPALQASYLATCRQAVSRQTATVGGLKVSAKGAISLYGVRKFPVTFYPQEWHKILAKKAEIEAFETANKGKLAYKTASVSSVPVTAA